MPVVKTVKLSELQYETTTRAARIYGESLSNYGKRAISLLGFATVNGFNTADTKLLVRDTTGPGKYLPLDIPHLSTPRHELTGMRIPLAIRGLSDQSASQLTAFAEAAGISEEERIRRALKFQNFVVEHCLDEAPVFKHADLAPVVPIIVVT